MISLQNIPNLTPKLQSYAKHIENANAKGISMAAYARAHDLSVKGIHVAHTKLRKLADDVSTAHPTGFIKVSAKKTSLSRHRVNVSLVNGCSMELMIDDKMLSTLLSTMVAT